MTIDIGNSDKNMRIQMTEHRCVQEETIGRFKAFMIDAERHMTEGSKWRIAIISVALAIVLQIGGFFYFWGGMTVKVNRNEFDINKLCDKLDKVISELSIK